ncbi:MAG: glycosyltransferase family protein [Balneolaceae bacterium]
MKILYGIQGTGHGHISRARAILPKLMEKAQVDVLLSGTNCKLGLDSGTIIRKRGISFEYDAGGSISILGTALGIDPFRLVRDIHELPVEEYDLVVSDFEPITAWAAFTSGVPSIGMSHQASFLSGRTPRPKKISPVAESFLKRFVPCSRSIGFHFQRYDRFIEPPIIRDQVLSLSPETGGHITVYLPSFDHQTLISILEPIDDVRWEIFSPYCDKTYTHGSVSVFPVGNEPFLQSLEQCLGVLSGAGFETCAESMYLGKKLMVLPIRNQYEQLCNAAALQQMGVSVLEHPGRQSESAIRNWLRNSPAILLPEIADTDTVTNKIIRFAKRRERSRAKMARASGTSFTLL